MFTRYISWLGIGLAAAFLVVASSAFTSLRTVADLGFAISIGTLVVSAGIGYRYRKHIPTVLTAAVTVVVSAWTLVACLVFSVATARTLAFAGSLAIAGLALVGLTVHELSSERVTHSLEVTETTRESTLASAA